jgi:formiminotetrahydrofolate cyclodeaminase
MARPPAPLSQQSLTEVLDQVADRTPGPGGGTVAALAVAFAAALVEMTSKFDDTILAQARATRANALRARMLEIADVERTIYVPVLEAEAMDPAHPQREQRLAAALAAASSPPLATAGAGAQIAFLAAESATQGNPALIGDAVTAAELADGATRAAAHLVRMNLSDSPGDPRRTEVTGLVGAAAEALEEAFAAAAEPEGSAPAQ